MLERDVVSEGMKSELSAQSGEGELEEKTVDLARSPRKHVYSMQTGSMIQIYPNGVLRAID